MNFPHSYVFVMIYNLTRLIFYKQIFKQHRSGGSDNKQIIFVKPNYNNKCMLE